MPNREHGHPRSARVGCTHLAVALTILLVAGAPGADDQPAPADPTLTPPAWTPAPIVAPATEPGPSATPWLEEVRAQRQAIEARHQAAREAVAARHRAADPWGATRQEARADELQRRREARRQRIEQDREHFRGLSAGLTDPWAEPWSPPPAPREPGADARTAGRAPDVGKPSATALTPGDRLPQPPPVPRVSPPQDWNNLWYFRGY
jgi:hypothetical protein